MKALRTGLIFLKIVRFSHDLQIFEEKLDYWTHAIALVTSNNSFGPTEISYLENQFTNIAKDAGRYQVTNGNDPSPGTVTEEKQAELDEFIDYARLITGALGYRGSSQSRV